MSGGGQAVIACREFNIYSLDYRRHYINGPTVLEWSVRFTTVSTTQHKTGFFRKSVLQSSQISRLKTRGIPASYQKLQGRFNNRSRPYDRETHS